MRFRPQAFHTMLAATVLMVGASALIAAETSFADPAPSLETIPALSIAATADSSRSMADILLDQSLTPSLTDQDAPLTDARRTAEIDCLAKVVHHEASNQSRLGQLAVAHVLINRTRSGRFPATLCEAAMQPGQFFNIASYKPRRDTATWRMALDVATEALDEEARDVTNGAYFFHAARSAPNRFFRSRERVMQVEDHIFYR